MPDIKSLVENPHVINRRYSMYWDFLLNSYEGGVDYTNANIPQMTVSSDNDPIPVFVNGEPLTTRNTSTNLFKHPKEKQEDFNKRVSMSYYYNFCQPIIDIYTEHLFKQAVTEDWGNIEDIIEHRGENVDRRGSSLIEFRKEMGDLAQIYGHGFVLVDKPKSQGEITLEQKINNDMFPYTCFIAPQQMLNWSLDRFGSPFWVLYWEWAEVNEDFEQASHKSKPKKQYRVWTREWWYLYNDKYELVEEGFHAVGKVPVIPFYDRPSKKQTAFLGISQLSDIAFIARDIFNSSSELKQIFRDQTFSILTLQGDKQEYSDLLIGTNKGLVYPADRNQPGYISPPPENARVLMEHIEIQVRKIHQLAKLEGGSAKQDKQVTSQSGVSKAFDFQQTNSSLSRKAANLNDAERKVWEMMARWEGKEWEGQLQYPDEFSVQAVNDDIEEALEMKKLNLGKLAVKEVNKAILQKKFPRLPDDELQAMIGDMEAEVDKGEVGKTLFDRLKNRQQSGSSNQDDKQGGENEQVLKT